MLNRFSNKKRIAIFHDALCVTGGAERIAWWMAKAYPEATLFTSVYLPDHTFPEFASLNIRTLPFSHLAKSERQFKRLYPLWLLETGALNFSDFDVVLTSSTYLAKYIRLAPGVCHRAYIHAPFRFLWKPDAYSWNSLPFSRLPALLSKATIPILRKWDLKVTRNIPNIATNSQNMANEIERIYHKPARVINPPVPIDEFPLSTSSGDFFLIVSRLISHKRVDLAIEACKRLNKPLVIVGEGPERSRLEQLSNGGDIRFVGRVFDRELKDLYQQSRAVIFPSHEDYGIVPLEAQACGKPVVAFRNGGVLETVLEGETGIFFDRQEVDSLVDCLGLFEKRDFSPVKIRQWARRFDIPQFYGALKEFVESD